MQTLRPAQRRALQQLFASRSSGFRQLYQSTQPTFRTRTTPPSTKPTRAFAQSTRPSFYTSLLRTFRQKPTRRFQSTTSSSSSSSTTPPESLSFSQRLKKLSREYGWSAVGVYLALSALDFPFCFLAVRTLGTDRIGHWEHVVVSTVKEWIIWPLVGTGAEHEVGKAVDESERVILKAPLERVRKAQGQTVEADGEGVAEGKKEVRLLEEKETYVIADHGYKEAHEASSRINATLWTQLVLAYAIHKSFIFIRVPLTAAVTPKVVKTLRGWGWNIGKMPKRGAGNVGAKGDAGVNTKGSGVKPDN